MVGWRQSLAKNRITVVEGGSKKKDGFLSFSSEISGGGLEGSSSSSTNYHPGGLFASVGQMGMGFGVSPNTPNQSAPSNPRDNAIKVPCTDLYVKYASSPEFGFRIVEIPQDGEFVEELEEGLVKKNKGGFKLKVKVANPSLRRLISGAIAGVVSRTAVAPLETIRTHLMVGSSGDSTTEVFNSIMKTDGWKGLFRGSVAPSKAI